MRDYREINAEDIKISDLLKAEEQKEQGEALVNKIKEEKVGAETEDMSYDEMREELIELKIKSTSDEEAIKWKEELLDIDI